MRWLALACLMLAACGPVLLFGDEALDASVGGPMQREDATVRDDAASDSAMVGPAPMDDAGVPHALVSVRATDCGQCYELVASATGGVPPYSFEWDDGTRESRRRVCGRRQAMHELSVVVQDANAARSTANVTRLDIDSDASCPDEPAPSERLCLDNPSFEGTPAANFGLPGNFDAPPWNACTNPVVGNTPDIGNHTLAQTRDVPEPSDGITFLALMETEQASQTLCEGVLGGTRLHLQLDLTRIYLSGMPESEKIFLEIWGGIAADCTARQLLWASEPLSMGWKTYCIDLMPLQYMDQITLRANSDESSVMPSYLLVDNLVPVDSCP